MITEYDKMMRGTNKLISKQKQDRKTVNLLLKSGRAKSIVLKPQTASGKYTPKLKSKIDTRIRKQTKETWATHLRHITRPR